MSDNLQVWNEGQEQNGWVMPTASRWKRLPIIRHLRALRDAGRVAKHENFYRSLGMIPQAYDKWVVLGIWLGMERDPTEDD